MDADFDTKSADLTALRIDRSDGLAKAGGPPRWLFIGGGSLVLVAAAVVLVALNLRGGVSARLTPAVLISPAQASTVVIASGYVVAQRKAAVASKGTGRLVYLGVVEGDRVRQGQVIARIEDSDVRAALAQAQANLQLGRADLNDATQALRRQRVLLDSGLTTQETYDAAEARHARVVATIAIAQAAVVTLADLASLQVEVDVSEASIEQVVAGQPCEIVLDAYPEVRYPGVVAKIVPTADRAKATIQVKVAFRRYDGRVLPETAVALRDGRSVVYTVTAGRAVEIPVVTGRRVGSGIAVLQGLAVGTQVIDSVDDRVRRGVKVKVP